MAQKEIVMNIKLEATEAIQQIKELAVNTRELKDRKKELETEIKAEEKAVANLSKQYAQGKASAEQLAAAEDKLARVKKQNVEQMALLDTALRGNSGRMRELVNDVSGLTDEGLRFRDKMADAFTEAFAPLAKEITGNLAVAQRQMAEALREFGAQSNQFQQAAAKAGKLEKAIDEVKQAQLEATTAIKKFGEGSDEFKEANDRLKVLEATAKGLSDEFKTVVEEGVEPLKTQLREAREEAQRAFVEFGAGSEQFKRATEAADELQDAVEKTNEQIKLVGEDEKIIAFGKSIGLVTGAFSAAQGAMALFGGESQVVVEALLKVQAAMAIQQGISGLVEGAKAAKGLATSLGLIAPAANGGAAAISGLRGVLLASGIGAAVVLIGTLVSSMINLGEATEDAAAGQERLNKAFDKARASQQRNLDFLSEEKLLLLEQKKLAEGRTEDTREDIEERNRIIAAGLQNQLTLTILTLKREEDAVKKAKAAELEAFRTGSEEQQKAASEALDKAEERLAQAAERQKDLINEQKLFRLQSANEIASFDVDAEQDAADKRIKANEQIADQRKKLSEEELRLRQEIAQREVAQINEQILLTEKLLNEAEDARLEGFQREENAIRDKYFTAITLAEENSAEQLALIDAMNAEIEDKRKKFDEKEVLDAQEKAQKLLDIEKEKAELQFEIDLLKTQSAEAVFNALGQLAEDGTDSAKFFLAFEKAAAIATVFINLSKEISAISLATKAQVAAASTTVAGLALVPGLEAKGLAQIAAAKVRAGINTALIAKQVISGFAEGGYTGPGGKYEPAGIVHKGEYVLPQEVVRALGVQRLDALRSMYTGAAPGRGSYATGGMVQATLSSNAILAAQNAAAANTMNLQPVLPVESLRAVMNRVEVREARATL